MITNTSVTINTVPNPDTTAIQQRSTIDITVSSFDVSASGYSEKVKFLGGFSDSTGGETVLVNEPNIVTGSTYYTPLYSEKISYTVWKDTINKSFRELESR
jgi:hypothetical protein